MEKLDIILWVLGGGFSLMLIMWYALNSRIDRLDNRIDKLDNRIDKVDDRIVSVEKELNQLSTRVAVIESKISDINTNVTYLMWHSQVMPHKEAQEE